MRRLGDEEVEQVEQVDGVETRESEDEDETDESEEGAETAESKDPEETLDAAGEEASSTNPNPTSNPVQAFLPSGTILNLVILATSSGPAASSHLSMASQSAMRSWPSTTETPIPCRKMETCSSSSSGCRFMRFSRW